MTRTASKRTAPEAQLAPHVGAAAALLKALANPQRLRILCALAPGEMSVGVLNEHVPLSQSALSQHLAVLRQDGLVQTRREAQTVFYRATPGPGREVIRVLHAHFCGAAVPPGDRHEH